MASSSSKAIVPKSILKNSSKQKEDAVAARNRELAIHHALIIQHQKDVEMAILESIEALIEYPHRTTDPAQPDPIDVKSVKEYLRSFRPSDFDSAVEERNLDEKCGYMLCPRPRVKQATSAKFRVLRGQNLRVVKTSDLEKWCSDECAKRALYLRVQLKEDPPWNRSNADDGGLLLYGETYAPAAAEDIDNVTRDLQKLALERGEVMNSFRAQNLNIDLQERFDDMNIDDPVPPSLGPDKNAGLIEGYNQGTAIGRNKDPFELDNIRDKGDILDSI